MIDLNNPLRRLKVKSSKIFMKNVIFILGPKSSKNQIDFFEENMTVNLCLSLIEILANTNHFWRFPVIKMEISGIFRLKIVKFKFETDGYPT